MTVEEEEPRIRQIGMTSLNESVLVSSSDPKENLEFLSSLAVKLFHELKKTNGK